MILFLNKRDLFQQKIKTTDMCCKGSVSADGHALPPVFTDYTRAFVARAVSYVLSGWADSMAPSCRRRVHVQGRAAGSQLRVRCAGPGRQLHPEPVPEALASAKNCAPTPLPLACPPRMC